jgi:hypothetical protein
MHGVTLWLRVLFAALLLGTILAGFRARPPRRRPAASTWRYVLAGAFECYILGALALAYGLTGLGAVLIAVGVELLCLAAWLARSRGEDELGDEDGHSEPPGDPGDPEPEPSFDEREFWDWLSRRERERELAGRS